MAEAIPLFPLSSVLLPGMPLPLHIFEQRYRDLLADVTAGGRLGAFGVVALRSGTEAMTPGAVPRGGGSRTAPEVEQVGTLAELLEVEPKPDGTSDLLSVGSRRFRVVQLLPEGTSYLRAEVEWLDEPDGAVTAELAAGARELLATYDALLARLAGRTTGDELPDDANQLSYHLAARVPLPPGDRQDLLEADTTEQRLKRLAVLLRREIPLLRRTRSVAVAPATFRLAAGLN